MQISRDAVERLYDQINRAEQSLDDLAMRVAPVTVEIQKVISAKEVLDAARTAWADDPTHVNKTEYDKAQGSLNGLVTVLGIVAQHNLGEFL